jgi:hypothetical protein
LALVLLGVGIVELPSRKVRLLECRLGFALWYVIPSAAFLSGSVAVGALTYGTYGFARGMSVWPIMLIARYAGRDAGEWLILRARTAKTVAAVQLVAIGAAVVAGVGL